MAFAQRHLLGLEGVSRDDITAILDTAASFKEISERDIKKVPDAARQDGGQPVLRGQHAHADVVRDRRQAAERRYINISASSSSATKGETLLDTARNLAAMRPDAIVLRHPSSGAAAFSRARRLPDHQRRRRLPRASDAGAARLLTIREHRGSIAGLTVAIVGDILHSRVARSNVHALRALGARVRLVGPPTLLPPEFASLGVELHPRLADGVRDADVIMMLRIQRERQGANFFPTVDEYSHYFCLTEDVVRLAKPEVIILHPGPMNRGLEIATASPTAPTR